MFWGTHFVFVFLDRERVVGCLRHKCCPDRTVDFQNQHRPHKFTVLLDGVPVRFGLYNRRFRQVNQASLPLGDNYGFSVAFWL